MTNDKKTFTTPEAWIYQIQPQSIVSTSDHSTGTGTGYDWGDAPEINMESNSKFNANYGIENSCSDFDDNTSYQLR